MSGRCPEGGCKPGTSFTPQPCHSVGQGALHHSPLEGESGERAQPAVEPVGGRFPPPRELQGLFTSMATYRIAARIVLESYIVNDYFIDQDQDCLFRVSALFE